MVEIMTAPKRSDETPKQRLERIAEHAPEMPKSEGPLRFLMVGAIFLALVTMVFVAWGGGTAAMAIVREYSESLWKMSLGK